MLTACIRSYDAAKKEQMAEIVKAMIQSQSQQMADIIKATNQEAHAGLYCWARPKY